jgi:FkbM family methyltransferase
MQLAKSLPKYLLRHKIIDIFIRIGLQNKFTEICFNVNSKAFIDLTDPEPRNVFIKKTFEPEFFKTADAFLPEDGIFFDLGANVGFCSFGLIPRNPKSNYHLFEANASLIRLLTQSIKLHADNNFHLNHCCLNNLNGKTRFKIQTNQTGQSHVSSDHEEGIEIPNLVLDDYCDKQKLKCIDFAKIDIEGHELPALQGWKKSLASHLVKALYIEIIPENQQRYGRKTNAPLQYLESLGFTLFLYKESDFRTFGEHPQKVKLVNDSLMLAKFSAKDYPSDFSTDVLALSSYS